MVYYKYQQTQPS
ncbi:Protein of unknown function [Bacillus toyonensis]|nr:Protein of unknown function [Bacillus toyonensis]